ncbi:MAG: nucleotide-binding protein [Alphaproteobacteria bacterium]|nr:nucleotide-binding protein [Alphaproteobacteria bacterium]MDE2265242.1 nucleotide-binding protein [Alphaproteobacteria bacterium]MDE2498735.1 nucleotide-binding protein [Alphaproteobacteria bacterium]
MRQFSLALGLALIATPAFAQTIRPADAGAHVGQTITVEGVVSEIHTAAGSGTTFIDMGGRYPDNVFTAVIFPADARTFPNVGMLNGKTVDVIGPVRLYDGKPEIILKAAGQLKSR